MQRIRRGLGALVVMAAMLASSFAAAETPANLVVNGSFEDPVVGTGFVMRTSSFGGWSVASGSIDHIGSYWQAADGTQSIDMSGNSAGSIYQDIATVPGATYQLRFAMAGNPEGGSPVKSMTVMWGTETFTVTFDTAGQSKSSMGWTYHTESVTAADSSTRLQFISNDLGSYGVALDDVSLVWLSPSAAADCEPGTLNMAVEGNWITCYVELGDSYDVEQIDGSTVTLNGAPALVGEDHGWAYPDPTEGNIVDHNGNGIPERMFKFDRAAVAATLEVGEATLTLAGEVGGVPFTVSDTIRVIDEGGGHGESGGRPEQQPSKGKSEAAPGKGRAEGNPRAQGPKE